MKNSRQVTHAAHGHILTNTHVWSADSRRIVYDTRSDVAGSLFDGDHIETVDIQTGDVHRLYTAQHGAKCGVVTFDPTANRVVFILGPEHPTPDFAYGATRRQGVMVWEAEPQQAMNLDARDLVPPFTAGALRGGSHVHVFSPDGSKVSFTYEDEFLEQQSPELNQRNIGVSLLGRPVQVPRTHLRNHDGATWSVLLSRTSLHPTPGSDEISRAYEEGWLGNHQLAFLGDTRDTANRRVPEVFVLDIPANLMLPDAHPLQGTEYTPPTPPRGTQQRRLTHTPWEQVCQRPRFWVRPSPDGRVIAFLKLGSDHRPHLWLVPTGGGDAYQISEAPVTSAFTWNPDGQFLAFASDQTIMLIDHRTGRTNVLATGENIRPEAVVFAPNGQHIAYCRTIGNYNQIFVADVG